MVDSADIYFIQHFADTYSKSVCISVCGGGLSHTYCQVSLPTGMGGKVKTPSSCTVCFIH